MTQGQLVLGCHATGLRGWWRLGHVIPRGLIFATAGAQFLCDSGKRAGEECNLGNNGYR